MFFKVQSWLAQCPRAVQNGGVGLGQRIGSNGITIAGKEGALVHPLPGM